MIHLSLPHDAFKHLSAICKDTAKNNDEFTSSIHIVVRQGVAYIASCNGYVCGVFKRGLVHGDYLDGCFSIPWHEVERIANLKTKKPVFVEGYPEGNLNVLCDFYKGEAKKNDRVATMANILEKAVRIAESGELVPSPAAYCVRRDSYKLAFYDKSAVYHILQTKDKPEEMQLCFSEDVGKDYMAIVMPLRADDSDEAHEKERKFAKAFFA